VCVGGGGGGAGGFFCLGGGGGGRPPRAAPPPPPPHTLTTCPYEDFPSPERAHVGCDGELQLCQGMSAGNVWQRPLGDLQRDFDASATPVFREIVSGGPWALAQAEGLEPLLPLYADECHLCYELRSRLRAEGRYPAVLAPDQAYGVIGQRPAHDPHQT